MTRIGIAASTTQAAHRYRQSLQCRGSDVQVLLPQSHGNPADLIETLDGLLLSGGELADDRLCEAAPEVAHRDALDLSLLKEALERDVPVLCICRGMQVLNLAFGGGLVRDVVGHEMEEKDGKWASTYHKVYVSPGSKLGAIIGAGAFYRVNSRHQRGLREAQKASRLLASSYSLPDGIIEGLESPAHSWVIGVQCHPEREDEVPKAFLNLFAGFLEWAERFAKRREMS